MTIPSTSNPKNKWKPTPIAPFVTPAGSGSCGTNQSFDQSIDSAILYPPSRIYGSRARRADTDSTVSPSSCALVILVDVGAGPSG